MRVAPLDKQQLSKYTHTSPDPNKAASGGGGVYAHIAHAHLFD